ncbi:HET-domain-containing protein [Diaporthe amygdali]|uniref:HET-domain-containing protein n=1 Tax=Phomopsis amygdali TaxID=1214568 RepID=UPI0022FEAA08|nr:HET-domain-containing protein [Diaporthe amygdali]KAJ0120082.1 HET-domain-containing protein [Diaporthe amygdali]
MAQNRQLYTTLSIPLREIRLLQILPDSDPNSLQCELSVHRLDESEVVHYTALSYFWGQEDPAGRCKIVLNGHIKSVTPNLLLALQSFHELGDAGYLWADAICIQQSDSKEKMSQLSIMGEIYARATKTVIWLGPKEEDSDRAMDLVANLRQGDLAVPQFDTEMTRGLLAVTKLLHRPWWKRMWVVQEAFLSQNPIARCGTREVPFPRFVFLKKQSDEAYWSMQVKWRGITLFERVPFTSCLSNWDVTRAELKSTWRSSLFSWIISMSDKFEATELRDKVFALLGLVCEEDRAVIRPCTEDEKPLQEILIDVVLQSVRSEGLMFLSVVEPEDMRPFNLELPSWTPYLLGGQSTQNLIGYKPRFGANSDANHDAWEKLFLASELLLFDSESEFSQDRDAKLIFLGGCAVDEVTYTDPMPRVMEYRGPDDLVAAKRKAERVRATIDTIQKWELVALEPSIFPADARDDAHGGREEAFWRTLACDGSATRVRPLPLDCGHRFKAFMGRCPPPGRDVLINETLQDDWVREYAVPVVAKTMHRSFILTREGRMGLAVQGVAVGDLIIIAKRCNVPLIIRRRPDRGFKFIGDAYVHGIMDGQAVTQAAKQGLGMELFCLK